MGLYQNFSSWKWHQPFSRHPHLWGRHIYIFVTFVAVNGTEHHYNPLNWNKKTGRGDMLFTMICHVIPFLGRTWTKWWGIEGGCKAPLVRIGSRVTTKQYFGLLSLHTDFTRTMLSPQTLSFLHQEPSWKDKLPFP